MSQVEIPKWLQAMVDEVNTSASGEDSNWPDGKYPAVAFEAMRLVGEYENDSHTALLQLVIDEVEQLRKRHDKIQYLARCLRGDYSNPRDYSNPQYHT